jgi:hypothetical protein
MDEEEKVYPPWAQFYLVLKQMIDDHELDAADVRTLVGKDTIVALFIDVGGPFKLVDRLIFERLVIPTMPAFTCQTAMSFVVGTHNCVQAIFDCPPIIY